jgi:hypothetical protein
MTRRGLAFALAMLATPAVAHEPRKGPNGGLLVDAGAYHVEVVAGGMTIDVFLSDGADKPLAAQGFKATAVLAVGGKSVRVLLTPASGSRLTGQSEFTLPANPKGAVLLTGPDGKTAQARLN